MFESPKNAMACLCCLRPDSARLGIDKNNRPFTYCRMCCSRTFIGSRDGLAGMSLLAPQLMALLDAWRQAGLQTDSAISAMEQRMDEMPKRKAKVAA